MSNRNYRKRPKTKPCVTKVNGFWSPILVKRFPSQKFLRQSHIPDTLMIVLQKQF